MLVFVYGTLKYGQKNHSLLQKSKYIGEATTCNNYLLYDLGPYPCLVETRPGKGKNIKGEVWQVNEDTMKRLDVLEGVECDLYKRTRIRLIEFQDVWGYIYLQSTDDMEECGDNWSQASAK
jgi:gamma-glutamylcyclotransferase (GGCT)/AIG2-like uncharacterized protein YtfP